MRNYLIVTLFTAALIGCSGNPSPVPTTSGSPTAPAASVTPEATATPETPSTPGPSTDLSTRQGVQALSEMLDAQVADGVLTSKEMTSDSGTVVVWSGAEGVRRIDVDGETEDIKFYYQQGRVFQLGGSGTGQNDEGGEMEYTFWSGITEGGDLVGPPFKFVDGKAGAFPETEVREKETMGNDLLKKAAQ